LPAKYAPAPAVQEIGDKLVAQYHQHLLDCAVRVEYVFRDDVPKKNGKEVLGVARKISNLASFLAGSEHEKNEAETGEPFFCIVISYPWWHALNPAQREALVDHELCHCLAEFVEDENGEPTKEVRLKIGGHDVEEFSDVVRRHGLWLSDVRSFAQTIKQAELQLDLL